jgi:repressor LexA
VADLSLTKRQQEIFDFIKKHSAKHGYPPTVRDIGQAIGLTSTSTVHAHLSNLEKIGLLRRDPTKPRAIELLVDTAKRAKAGIATATGGGLPVVGRVAAGEPLLAEENIEEYVSVPPLAGGEDGEFLLTIAGDSMIGAGIHDGDHVVVHAQDTARDGEIVVALVGEAEATVKRFFKEADHIRLQPENDAMEPIVGSDVLILGRVVGVLRRVT